ncbi:hypothetical protein ACIGO8_00415 [Streptomyces sp. NPDC053493]|uniref:hypothetical protein n=1 Tax=Streptomyces sp. NPDC053493 TaxID=3365705 RepID=UPI0037D4C263
MDVCVYGCAGCGAELTAPVARVPLPPETHLTYGHGWLPPLMEPGTYAVDPEPSGPPYGAFEDLSEAEAEARGLFAPVWPLSFGKSGRIVVAPGDSRGTVLIPEHGGDSCRGVCAGALPTMACAACGLLVASRVDDCGLWQAVWYEPDAVRRMPATAPAPARPSGPVPPVLPDGWWNPRLEAAAGAALAPLLRASGGGPVALPDGAVGDVFGRALRRLLPAGGPAKRAGLAGPGLPGDGLDIALVPYDPATCEPWRPPGGPATVPLPASVWAYLAGPAETSPVPASGTLPHGVLRDDYPLPDHPWELFRPDRRATLRTLARMPEVRLPWLRALYERC